MTFSASQYFFPTQGSCLLASLPSSSARQTTLPFCDSFLTSSCRAGVNLFGLPLLASMDVVTSPQPSPGVFQFQRNLEKARGGACHNLQKLGAGGPRKVARTVDHRAAPPAAVANVRLPSAKVVWVPLLLPVPSMHPNPFPSVTGAFEGFPACRLPDMAKASGQVLLPVTWHRKLPHLCVCAACSMRPALSAACWMAVSRRCVPGHVLVCEPAHEGSAESDLQNALSNLRQVLKDGNKENAKNSTSSSRSSFLQQLMVGALNMFTPSGAPKSTVDTFKLRATRSHAWKKAMREAILLKCPLLSAEGRSDVMHAWEAAAIEIEIQLRESETDNPSSTLETCVNFLLNKRTFASTRSPPCHSQPDWLKSLLTVMAVCGAGPAVVDTAHPNPLFWKQLRDNCTDGQQLRSSSRCRSHVHESHRWLSAVPPATGASPPAVDLNAPAVPQGAGRWDHLLAQALLHPFLPGNPQPQGS